MPVVGDVFGWRHLTRHTMFRMAAMRLADKRTSNVAPYANQDFKAAWVNSDPARSLFEVLLPCTSRGGVQILFDVNQHVILSLRCGRWFHKRSLLAWLFQLSQQTSNRPKLLVIKRKGSLTHKSRSCNLVVKVLAWDLEVFNNNRNTLSSLDVSLILAKKNEIFFFIPKSQRSQSINLHHPPSSRTNFSTHFCPSQSSASIACSTSPAPNRSNLYGNTELIRERNKTKSKCLSLLKDTEFENRKLKNDEWSPKCDKSEYSSNLQMINQTTSDPGMGKTFATWFLLPHHPSHAPSIGLAESDALLAVQKTVSVVHLQS